MAEDRRISICITNYNRKDMLLECFLDIYNDERVSEIVISDDCSDMNIYSDLNELFKDMPKVKLFRNERNVDCYFNKKIAIELATNEWVAIIDSDNVIGKDYLDAIFEHGDWEENVIFAPTWAKPTFDYRHLETAFVGKGTVATYMKAHLFDTALNTFNFFINRSEYLKVWDGSVNPHTADSIYFNYCWLKAGNFIYFTPSMYYQHRIHNGSHYILNNHKTNGFYEDVLNGINQL